MVKKRTRPKVRNIEVGFYRRVNNNRDTLGEKDCAVRMEMIRK